MAEPWQDFEGVRQSCHSRRGRARSTVEGMETLLATVTALVFFLLLALAALTGHVHDSRDGHDWHA